MSSKAPISITGCGALGVCGHDVASHLDALRGEPTRFRTLSNMEGAPAGFPHQHAGWIEPRSLLTHRKWSPLSMATLHVAREALAQAGWSGDQRREAAVFFGTSRGALAGWIDDWPGRRPFGLMAASNSLPSEPASAVSSELGINGPWQVISTGCCAGLDALGMASLWLRNGLAKRALVAAADLPLVAPVLAAYSSTGILSSGDHGGSFSPKSDGMIPAEGAAAVCLEAGRSENHPQLSSYLSAGECSDPLGGASEHPTLSRMIQQAIDSDGMPDLIVPHASGTRAQATSEPAAIQATDAAGCLLLPFKSSTGHTIGASGLLETAMIAALLRQGSSPVGKEELPKHSRVFKIASAMGGKHSLVSIESAS